VSASLWRVNHKSVGGGGSTPTSLWSDTYGRLILQAYIDSKEGQAFFTKKALELVHEDAKQAKIDDNAKMVRAELGIIRARQQAKYDVRPMQSSDGYAVAVCAGLTGCSL